MLRLAFFHHSREPNIVNPIWAIVTKSVISDKNSFKAQSNFAGYNYSVKRNLFLCIFSLDSLRSSTSLQLRFAWLWSLVLQEKVKPNPKVLQENTTPPNAIISWYQGSLPTLLGIHQPLLGSRALKKSSQLLFVTKCTMLHFVRNRTAAVESRRW